MVLSESSDLKQVATLATRRMRRRHVAALRVVRAEASGFRSPVAPEAILGFTRT